MAHRVIVFLVCFLVCCGELSALQNWDRFRGPNGTGLVADADLPDRWTQDDYRWKVKLAGEGSGSPVIWDQRLFVTSCNPGTAEYHVQCMDRKTGREIWKKSFPSTPYRLHHRNSYASSTPAIDADHVYIALASLEHTYLIALDHSGKEIWRRDFGRWASQHGFGMSPIVFDDKVIFCNSQGSRRLPPGQQPGTSRVIAVDRKTGKDRWAAKLTTTRACYCVPAAFKVDGSKPELIGCNTGDGFYSLDPETGKMNWSALPFRMRTVASTLVAGELVLGSCGSGGGGNYLVAVRPTKTGAQKAYEIGRSANYVPTPVAVEQLLFLFGDKGVVTCLDLPSGSEHWKQRVSSGFSGSPVATSDNVYCIDEEGNVVVIKTDKEFELSGKYPLGEPSRATPAIAANNIFFRTTSQLFCVGRAD